MSDQEWLRDQLMRHGMAGRLMENEPLALHTSFGIGGPADLFAVAEKPDELSLIAQLTHQRGMPLLVLGGGTNVLVADAGVRGVVVAVACRRYAIEPSGMLHVEAGAPLREVASWCVEQGWAGLEWAVGIPGTVGGAIVGNAGAYGGCIADVLRSAQLLDRDGAPRIVDVQSLAYGYRSSVLKREPKVGTRAVVLAGTFELSRGEPLDLRRKADGYRLQRAQKTPQGRSAGSVFKRTMQYPAGFLIEQSGLKGLRVGGAEISPLHANFILNVDGATASDVRALIERVQERVWATMGQRLEPEIEFVGDWDTRPRS